MKISDMRVSTRLSAGFFLVLLLMLLMGVCAYLSTRINVRDVDKILTQHLQEERLTGKLLTLVDRNRGNTIAAMGTQYPALREKLLISIANDSVQTTTVMSHLEPLLTHDTAKRLFADIGLARKKYLALRNEGMSIAAANEHDRMDEFISGRFLPATQEFIHALQGLESFQKQLIDEAHVRVRDASRTTEWLIIVFVALAVTLGSVIACYINHSITRPLKEAVAVASRVAQGDLTTNVSVNSQDELGQLMHALREMIIALGSTVNHVRTGAESIVLAANEIDAGNQDLASRTEEQVAGVTQTAATLEQLTSTIEITADNARQVNDRFTQTAQAIKINSDRMHDVSSAMDDIHEASEKMTDIITVIEGIAFQTNILALNAAVEAARAGEQGRGFAVVAKEVRTLAQRSSNSAREIRDIISTSLTKIADGRGIVLNAGTEMQDIVENV